MFNIRMTLFAGMLLTLQANADEPVTAADGPEFASNGHIVRPANYREWPLIGTGVNMVYGPAREKIPSGMQMFTNVFVNPTSYRAFLTSGAWPDKTMFVLEIRGSVPVNKVGSGANGLYQGEVHGLEAEVKDTTRFANGWGFFSLNPAAPTAAQIPTTASCYACHAKNAAVENTFTQFYPVLRDIAREKNTFKQVAEVF
jgi:Cytochrome P460